MPTEPVPVNEYITDLEAQWDPSKVDSNFSNSAEYKPNFICLLYTSDAADDSLRGDVGGGRMI